MLLEEYDDLIGMKHKGVYLGGGVDYHVYTKHVEVAYTGCNLDKTTFAKTYGVVGLVDAYNAELKSLREELRSMKTNYDDYRKEKEEGESRLRIRLERAESEREILLEKVKAVRAVTNGIAIY